MAGTFPAAVLDAFEKIVASGLATITSALEPCAITGGGQCGVLLRVPQPNPLGLPAQAAFDLRLPADPYGRVILTATDPTFQGFAHQSSDGTVCLKPEKNHPTFAERVLAYINGGLEWLVDAANDRLLEPDQPWELPDFRMKSEAPPLLFLESKDGFKSWRARVGQHGRVDLADHVQAGGVVAVRFYLEGAAIVAPSVSSGFCATACSSPARWILLDSFIVERHRRPRTFAELEMLAQRVGIDLWRVIHRALKHPSVDGYRYLLVGAPIPRLVGQPPIEVHWQPIAFPAALARELRSASSRIRHTARRERIRSAIKDREIPWATATNVSSERLLARGALLDDVRKKRICLIGCGAIGSLLAEHLARGGAHDLALFDEETLDFENLGRHALGAAEVGENKAVALAARLAGFLPQATIIGYPLSVPPQDARATRDARAAIAAADVIIDCTASDTVLQWVNGIGRHQHVLHVYANAGATMLTISSSGRHASCVKVDSALHADIAADKAPFTAKDYDPDIREIEPGAGCWSPTFPARGSDLASLVATGVGAIERLIARQRQSRGRAIVIRRHDLDDSMTGQVVVEVALVRDYR